MNTAPCFSRFTGIGLKPILHVQCALCFLFLVFYLLLFSPLQRFYRIIFLASFKVNFYLGQHKTKNRIKNKKTKCQKIVKGKKQETKSILLK